MDSLRFPMCYTICLYIQSKLEEIEPNLNLTLKHFNGSNFIFQKKKNRLNPCLIWLDSQTPKPSRYYWGGDVLILVINFSYYTTFIPPMFGLYYGRGWRGIPVNLREKENSSESVHMFWRWKYFCGETCRLGRFAFFFCLLLFEGALIPFFG